jgi:hypothetical protein
MYRFQQHILPKGFSKMRKAIRQQLNYLIAFMVIKQSLKRCDARLTLIIQEALIRESRHEHRDYQ